MATPIKPTPVLEGKDAERFLKAAANPKKISKKERKTMLKNFNRITYKEDEEDE